MPLSSRYGLMPRLSHHVNAGQVVIAPESIRVSRLPFSDGIKEIYILTRDRLLESFNCTVPVNISQLFTAKFCRIA
jgi:hypothetical protein